MHVETDLIRSDIYRNTFFTLNQRAGKLNGKQHESKVPSTQ